MDEFTYELLSQAMLIYQDELGDSDSKVKRKNLLKNLILNIGESFAINHFKLGKNKLFKSWELWYSRH